MIKRLFLLLLLFATPAHAEQTVLHYGVYVGGLHAISSTMTITLENDRYETAVTAQTNGLTGSFFEWESRAQSRGIRGMGEVLQPLRYDYDSLSHNTDRDVMRFEFIPGEAEIVKYTGPTQDTMNEEAVRGDVAEGAVDFLTAVTDILLTTDTRESCTTDVDVFDGRRRIRLSVEDAGLETLRESRYNVYAGEARKCRVAVDFVTGKWRKSHALWMRRDPRDEKIVPVTLWLAEIAPDLPPVPVRIRIDSPFGIGIVHLDAVEPL